jgi:hypothetical protein
MELVDGFVAEPGVDELDEQAATPAASRTAAASATDRL